MSSFFCINVEEFRLSNGFGVNMTGRNVHNNELGGVDTILNMSEKEDTPQHRRNHIKSNCNKRSLLSNQEGH